MNCIPPNGDKLYQKEFWAIKGVGVIIKHYLPSEMIIFCFDSILI